MADIALFHSVLGLRPGMYDAARRFTEAGHKVLLVDQYDGEVFDDYEDAAAFAEKIGFPELMGRALTATAGLADGFVSAGFSNGAGMAQFVATQRPVGGVLMFAGAVSMEYFEGAAWPAGVPAQIHTTARDPWREQAGIDSVVACVQTAGGSVEAFDYPGAGHLFMDASMAAEYDEAAAELLWERVLAFCAKL